MRDTPAESATGGIARPAIWAMLVVSTVAWRQGSLYEGGLDPVVVLKAGIQVCALAWAVVLNLGAGRRQPLPAGSLAILSLLVLISCVGGFAAGNTVPSLVIAVRILMLAATVALMFRAFTAQANLLALLTTMGGIGLLSAASGLVSGVDGRLSGGIPPLSPNEIALLVGAPALALLHEMVRDRLRLRGMMAFIVLATVLALSESRSALVAAVLGVCLIVVQIRRLPLRVVAAIAVLVPLAFAVLAYTPLLRSLVFRADSASLSTLNSRTISWNAVLDIPLATWERWIGTGLSTKEIAVSGQYWDMQVFDSSWFSVLAQAGAVGTAILLLWVAWALVAAVRRGRVRTLTLGLLAFLLVRSILENGLVDASAAFLLFFSISLVLERPVYAVLPSWDEQSPLGPQPLRTPADVVGSPAGPTGGGHRAVSSR